MCSYAATRLSIPRRLPNRRWRPSPGWYVGVSATGVFPGRQNGSRPPLTDTVVPGGPATGRWYRLTLEAVGRTIDVTGSPADSTGR